MRVLVTGGTGFVGGHAVAALVAAGHDVRLLVRRPEQVSVTLDPLGVEIADIVVGDVLDESSVKEALGGQEAVVHAAAIFTTDPRKHEEIRRTNVRATELVLGQAAERGLDPVVHVSSTVALTRYGGSGPDLPLGDMTHPYSLSKIQSEQVARRLQDAGYPVVSVYPGGVWGPHDPYRGDNDERLRWVLAGRFPIWPTGGVHYVDVRDVAAVIAAVLQPDRGPRRYVVPGHFVTGEELYATASRVTGRRLLHVPVPARFLAMQMRLVDQMMARMPERVLFPGDTEGVELNHRATRFDDSPARTELSVTPHSLEETIRDTARWMIETGRLKPGRLRN